MKTELAQTIAFDMIYTAMHDADELLENVVNNLLELLTEHANGKDDGLYEILTMTPGVIVSALTDNDLTTIYASVASIVAALKPALVR